MIVSGPPKRRDAGEQLHVLMLSMQVRPLAKGLAAWEPVGVLLQSLHDAGAGVESLTHADAARVRSWSRRWSSMSPSLRSFYADHAHIEDAAGAALFHILCGKPGNTHEHTRRTVHNLWIAWAGCEPGEPLWPRLH